MTEKELGMSPEQYEARLRFERTVSRISSRFVTLTADIGASILQSLGDMGRASGASRAYIFELKDDMTLMDNTYEWCADGVAPEIDNLRDLPTSLFPWWMSKLTRNELILIPEVAAMQPEAAAEKAILEAQDVKALVVLPVLTDGNLAGFIGFDNVLDGTIWDEDAIVLLRLVAEIFGNAFQRLHDERMLKETNRSLAAQLEEIRQLQQRLIHQEKLVGIGQLAAGVAHEINNPLTFVSGNVEMMQRYMGNLRPVLDAARKLMVGMGLETAVKPGRALTSGNAVASEGAEKAENILAADAQGASEGVPLELAAYKARGQALVHLWNEMKTDHILADLDGLLDDTMLGVKRVAGIVSALRKFAREESPGSFSNVSIPDILDEILTILHSEVNLTAVVKKEYACRTPIRCDRNQVGQVFLNLLVNAVHAIRKADRGRRGEIRIQVLDEGEYVAVRVSDDGIGMSREVLEQAFNPFFTTKAVGEGTGLGLSISYDIISNMHHGEIHVESEPGVGTTFLVRLPKRQPA